MRALSAPDVLRAWEQGARRHALDRALLLLSAALPEEPFEELAALPLGSRDLRLLELRAATFGPDLPFFASCPRCGQAVDFTLSAAQLAVGEPAAQGSHELRSGGAVIRFRLPDSRDLAALDGRPSEEAEELLLQRCVLEAWLDGAAVSAAALPAGLRQELAKAMAEADPQAEISIDLGCPACEHRWPMLFDVLTVVWSDVTRQANRLLQEVDALARVYGWREDDVLAMSAHRRALYLEMATA
jgi:hypothetical protein